VLTTREMMIYHIAMLTTAYPSKKADRALQIVCKVLKVDLDKMGELIDECAESTKEFTVGLNEAVNWMKDGKKEDKSKWR
jgi:hypothetical protein